MQFLKYSTVITLFLFISTGWAGENQIVQDKPRIYSSDTMKINALVESVDYATREVTLRDPGGELITFTAGEEVRNLEQMEVGDSIHVEYTQSYAIEVYGGSGYVPAASDFSDMGVAEIGDKPALSSIDTRVITATVEEIDLEANTFKLRWPDDTVEGFVALNPENLNKAEVGDLVVITETVALDISVEETPVD